MAPAYVTTAACPDGTYYGAAWNGDDTLIAMSSPLPTRGAARRWALKQLPKEA